VIIFFRWRTWTRARSGCSWTAAVRNSTSHDYPTKHFEPYGSRTINN